MNFNESGLPQNKLVEEAFLLGQAQLLSGQAEAVKEVEQQIKEMYEANMAKLENFKSKMTEEQYKKNLDLIQRKYKEQLKVAPVIVARELNSVFEARHVYAAKESYDHASAPSLELTAAVLILDCARSPIDYLEIDRAFGGGVSGIVAHVAHLETHPEKRAEHFKTVSDDVKRAYLMMMTGSIHMVLQKTREGNQLQLSGGQEQVVLADLKAVYGTDAKLERRFILLFNETMEATKSQFRLSIDAKGRPQLTEGDDAKPARPPRGPTGPGNNGGNGGFGDVF